VYLLHEPYDKAVASIRAALRQEGFVITSETDVAENIRRDCGVVVSPCKRFTLDSPVLLLTAMTNNAAGGVTPIQAIVTETDFDVAVHIVLPGSPGLVWPVHRQLETAARQICKAMASVGARKLLYQVKT
jgi:hypothetical protein